MEKHPEQLQTAKNRPQTYTNHRLSFLLNSQRREAGQTSSNAQKSSSNLYKSTSLASIYQTTWKNVSTTFGSRLIGLESTRINFYIASAPRSPSENCQTTSNGGKSRSNRHESTSACGKTSATA